MAALPQNPEPERVMEAEDDTITPGEKRSTLSLLRTVVLDLTQVVEDSTELIGASVREELAQFRVDMARLTLSLAAATVGASLVTAGLAMLVSRWLGSWPYTLLLFGGVYLAGAFLLLTAFRKQGDAWK